MPQPNSAEPAPAVLRNTDLDEPAVHQARVELAACFRMAARLGLHEGICNHFSFVIPGHDDLFLVNPYGYSFAEITASRLLICDFAGGVHAGEGVPEPTAFHIHARLHMHRPHARAVFHTHMPNATALSIVAGDPLVFAGQTALKFYGRIAVDRDYNGLALDSAEGDRIARAMGSMEIAFLKHHGVIVTAPSIAEAWDDLYYLERACQAQRLAESTGRTVVPVPNRIAEHTARQMRGDGGEAARLHLASVCRILDREAPDYRH